MSIDDLTGLRAPARRDEELSRLLDVASRELGATVRFLAEGTGGAGATVPVEGADGVHGVLHVAPAHPLDPGLERFLGAFARLVGDRLDEQHERTQRHRARLDRVRWVLETDALAIVYQPILNLGSGETVGFEALARFPGDGRAPERVFGDARAAGLDTELETRAVAMAVEAFTTLPEDHYLSVNVSPRVAALPGLRRSLRGFPVERLVLEITEHDEVSDYVALNRALRPLRRRGLRLAVDDAGAGFASLRHILRIDPDIIKLDRSLIRDIDRDTTLRALSYSISSFGSAVNAQVVAEGIETEAELHTLQFIGVEYGQGFLLQAPGALPGLRTPQRVTQTMRA